MKIKRIGLRIDFLDDNGVLRDETIELSKEDLQKIIEGLEEQRKRVMNNGADPEKLLKLKEKKDKIQEVIRAKS